VQGFLRGDGLAAQDQLVGLLWRDVPGQHRGGDRRETTQPDLRHPERGSFLGHDHVAREHELEPAAQSDAAHGRDRDALDTAHLADEAVEMLEHRAHAILRVLGDVHTGGERSLARRGQDADGRGVALHASQGRGIVVDGLRIENVEGRMVECDARDAVLELVPDQLLAHFRPPDVRVRSPRR